MDFKYEKLKLIEGFDYIIGCDEVGRGCLAGPVVAAAVALPQVESLRLKVKSLQKIKDSKLLSAKEREYLDPIIKSNFFWSIAEVSPRQIDKINIHNASLLAMKKAVEGLSSSVVQALGLPQSKKQAEGLHYISPRPKMFLFVDGKFPVPNLNIEQKVIIGGDNKVLSIAAASIIAKVYRDSLMSEFDKQYPAYELAKHKGYATLQHRKMIIQNGLSPIHRLTFCEQYLRCMI